MCKRLGIRNLFTTAYHPQTNGQVERFNRTILAALRRFTSEDQRHWDVFSNAVTFAYNTQSHSSTVFSPFELVLSRPPHPLAVEQTPAVSITGENPHQVRQRFVERIAKVVASARIKLAKSQARYKANYDKTVRTSQPLKIGQAVFVRREQRAEDRLLPSQKLKPKVDGPYEIIRVTSHTVTISRDGLQSTVSRDRVTRAPTEPSFDWTNGDVRPADGEVSSPRLGSQVGDPIETRTVARPSSLDGSSEGEPLNPGGDNATDDDPEDEIEKLVAYRPKYGFCVRWAGFDASHDTWHQPKDLPYGAMVDYFHRKNRTVPPSIKRLRPQI